MPRISVVVPIYNVESYLEACLESIAGQTVADLEVVMVDDGSTDGSAAIAEAFVARDPRFRLVTQPNAGLGAARNTGADAATGEFLAFVDSDDVLVHNAYELLLGALDRSGSDFATGNVHRLTSLGTRQAPFLARTFTRNRLATHVTRFRALLVDRIAPNKLWRRSFWDEHGLRFPEGVVHEDIPVVVPAQFLARSVDVIADPIYLYRQREGADLSITQRRREKRVLLDRLAAVEHVSDFLEERGETKGKGWYDSSVVAEDLRYYLNVLEDTDEEYRAVFLDRVNAFLDRVGDEVYEPMAAIERLKWHLVRRRLMPELLEALRFQREDLAETPPVRIGRHWYGDYPFRGDERLAIPQSVYRLDRELRAAAGVDALRWDGGRLRIDGWAYVTGLGAPTAGAQRVTLTAVRRGRFARLRRRIGGLRLKTTATQRPGETATAGPQLADVSWSGFSATLDPRRLRTRGRWDDGTWDLFVTVRTAGVKRRGSRFAIETLRRVGAVELPVGGDVSVRAARSWQGAITFAVRGQWAAVSRHALADGAIELSGELRLPAGAAPRLEGTMRDGTGTLSAPIEVDRSASPARFTTRVPLAELMAAVEPSAEPEDGIVWDLHVVADGAPRMRLSLRADTEETVWLVDGHEVGLSRTMPGDAAVVVRTPRPALTDARFAADGALELSGELHVPDEPHDLVLAEHDSLWEHRFALEAEAGGRFTVRVPVTGVPSLGGAHPLRAGRWELYARPAGASPEDPMVPLVLSRALSAQVPLRTVAEHKPFTFGTRREHAVLDVGLDLDDDERGSYNQRRLRETAYAARRSEPLRDAVLYSSFGGRQCSDSPRAIHDELVRRGAPLEHLWVVRDGMCTVPQTARAVRRGSREHHEALARSRYVVANDHLPDWYVRRDDQVCLQTWHGTPLKRLGLDVHGSPKAQRNFAHRLGQVASWQYMLSPNRFSTPILRAAYGVEGEMLETGLPRNDGLAGEGRDAATRRVRERLGLPDGVRTVLYAPTYRDGVIDSKGRYRLDLRLDLERMRDALGADTTLLLRPHHYIADAVPATADGFVRDVSTYPDGTELLLAADVLVTDYSSMMFDYANTGRPMLFFTYDLDAYRDEIRGFYFDLAEQAPGPLLRTNDELAEALADVDAVAAQHSERHRAFAATFCELDDGHAAARVVDRLFTW